VFSEPSNPYRAGVSSLYTREFYEAVRDQLGSDGLFLQWTQSYEVDGDTIATIYATLADVFPEVHTWRLAPADLLFVASRSPIRYPAAQIAERAASPVFRAALDYAWHVDGAEGFLSHFIGGTALARELAARAPGLNTDDRTLIEFAFARALGQTGLHNVAPLAQIAEDLHTARPDVVGAIDAARLDELRAGKRAALSADARARAEARSAYAAGNLAAALAAWHRQGAAPSSHLDQILVAEGLAAAADEAALTQLAALRPGDATHPTEVELITARLRTSQRRFAEATAALTAGLAHLRDDAFVDNELVRRSLQLAQELARASPPHAPRVLDAVTLPFAVYQLDDSRSAAALAIAGQIDDRAFAGVLAPIEPNVPWSFAILARRAAAYAALDHPLAGQARADLDAFVAGQPQAILPATIGEAADAEASDR
jgi:hypothetical protein